MDVVSVGLGDDRRYPIYIGTGILTDAQHTTPIDMLSHIHGNKVLVVTNDRVAPLYLDTVTCSLERQAKACGRVVAVETLVLADGEAHKSMDSIMKVMDKCIEARLDRKSTLVALGGGVIGDMVGFAAAIYQRGIDFIQIPTTLMAMVDSSVGGKTGVNHPLGKNMIGAFHQPNCVIIDTDTLNSLPDKELASGVAEVIKYGLIRDADFFQWQEENMDKIMEREPEATRIAIKRSCQNKAEVVAEDEKEVGVRATLNLGHTFGHAIENGLGYGEWLHGEAVATGMVMATFMSRELDWIDQDIVDRTKVLLKRAHLPLSLPKTPGLSREAFRETMALDKKVADGVLRLILLKGDLGSCVFTDEYDEHSLDTTLDHFFRDVEA